MASKRKRSDKEENEDTDEDIDILPNPDKDDRKEEHQFTNQEVTSYQEEHIRLGNDIILSVIITIPKSGLSHFQKDNNKAYAELVKLINGKLPQILQCEKNRQSKSKAQTAKSKSTSKKYKSGKFQVIKGLTVKFACRLQQGKEEYCFLENTKPFEHKDVHWVQRDVSPLCLNVIAAPLKGYLPHADDGDVLISQFYQTESSADGDKKAKKKKSKPRKKAKKMSKKK